ncbi:TetR/AcrR family transcriptional regulator [Nocardioides anomalus]|uniref:TetR/AcrR family transcriptional regulator n=1 Tax=Nocardioides anomalus TaxID=2712223 RepID=A0A6G6WJ94_9ACTN|nr:TetR/AcrR family transcriptional regulator [Nocardioides anomalus]QIG45276.1 TetR/AcrR family transcriptional regulator [Nocardioides anomalus]
MAGSAPADTDWSERRSDARRNHERVLAAAVEVFTEHGLDATIPQIAERAGVGKATVYRSYPTKADLVRAIAMVHIGWLRELIVQAAADAETDAYAALQALLEAVTTRLATDRLMADVLNTVDDLEEDPQLAQTGERLLDLAKEQGTLREDATMTDITVLVAGFAHSLTELEVTDPAVWRRYAMLTLAALRR